MNVIVRYLFLIATLLLTGDWSHGYGVQYYIGGAGANDSNSGLSSAAPWASIGKVNGFTFPNATITLNFQGALTGCLALNSANLGAAQGVTVQPYGTGYTITANCSGLQAAAININGISGVTVKNGTLVGDSGTTQYGVLIHNTGSALMSTTTISGMMIGGFWCGGTCTDANTGVGAEIIVYRAHGDGAISVVNLLNNTLGGSVPSSLDDNGIIANDVDATEALVSKLTITDNVIANLGSRANTVANQELGSAIFLTGITNGMVNLNLGHDLAGNLGGSGSSGNQAAMFVYTSSNVLFTDNFVYNNQPITYTAGTNWDAYDIDGGSSNITYEYNYAQNIYGDCQLVNTTMVPGGINNTVRYSIFENCGTGTVSGHPDNWSCFKVNADSSTGAVNIYNNTCYSNTGKWLAEFVGGTGITGYFANNILVGNLSGQNLIEATSAIGMTLINNDYVQLNASGFSVAWNGSTYTSCSTWKSNGGDANCITTSPSLTNPGNGGNSCIPANPQTCPTAYKLQSGSAMIGAGLNLTGSPYFLNVGSTNYFGAAIPNGTGTGYDIGAD